MKRLLLLSVVAAGIGTGANAVAGVHFGLNVGMPRPVCRPVVIAPQPCYVVQQPCYVVKQPCCCQRPRKIVKVRYHAPRPRIGFNFGFGL